MRRSALDVSEMYEEFFLFNKSIFGYWAIKDYFSKSGLPHTAHLTKSFGPA